MRKRQTIGSVVEISGRGVHSGESCLLRLLPAAPGAGVTFRRVDLDGAEVKADLANLVSDKLLRRTTLATGSTSVYTIEHVMSAFAGSEVDDVIVEMDSAEPPFVDGSALPFVELIKRANVVQQSTACTHLAITRPVAFRDVDAEICALPSEDLRISYFFSSDHRNLRRQAASLVISPETYAAAIAPARTFCFFDEIEGMRRQNLIKGANLGSAIVIGKKGILNDSLRFPDEPVRHKILDFIGDLALLGMPLKGHFLAWRSGHRTNAAFALHLKKEFSL